MFLRTRILSAGRLANRQVEEKSRARHEWLIVAFCLGRSLGRKEAERQKNGGRKESGEERRRGSGCRCILTASATVSLEFSLLLSSASGAAGGADFELRLLGGPAEHEMRPAVHRVPVRPGGRAALGAGVRVRVRVFQPFLQPDSFFFRGHGHWFQPELPVIAT